MLLDAAESYHRDCDPLLAARRALEAPYLAEVRSLSRRMAVVALAAEPPQGAERLLGLVASVR